MKKQIIVPKIDIKRQNSFWYKGFSEIAKFTKDDREIIISVCGEIRVQVEKFEPYLKNEQAVDKALELNLFDSDLKSLNFDESNWFDFAYKKTSSEHWEEFEDDERFTYNNALKSAKLYLDDDDFWKQF